MALARERQLVVLDLELLAHERAVFEAAIDSLREQLEVEDDELTLARQGQAALARYRSERDVGSPVDSAAPQRADRTKLVIGLASVAAAAGLALWLGLRRSDDDQDERVGTHEVEPPRKQAPEQRHWPEQRQWEPVDPTPPPAAPVDAVGQLSMLTSSVPIERLGARLEPGSSFASLFEPELWPSVERACVSWSEPTAVVCFEGELSASSNARVGERRVRLESGRLVAALAPLGPGQRFTIETLLGTVSAIGTVFAVEIYEGQAWVTVIEGRVELRDPTVRVLTAGHRTSLRGEVPGDEPTPLEADAIPTAVAQLVGFAELLRASPGAAQLQIPTLGEHAVYVDDHLLDGPAQLSIGAGQHALRVLDGQQAIVLEQPLALALEAPVDLTTTLPAAPASAEPHTPSKAPSAKQLAEAAQRERGQKNYKETARLYRELLRRYPDSPEAANVPVRLGDLLTSTGDHQGALEAYELYLDRGAKQLAPEAEYGRIQALRALGRKADERAAIVAFVAARPDDYRSTELKTRLAELDK
ncbi:MAG TPA: tetratricopeptide repeat protein [Enhygromyxa sp.]|nr:tetratricopeptide repeat protein [Enhygromyxa sp.]